MACECVSRIDEQLGPEHSLDISIFIDRGNNSLVGRPYSRILRKDNGKPETRSRKPSVFSFSYCPFCGVCYQAEPLEPRLDSDYAAALRLVVDHNKASTSFVQRVLKIGYNDAVKLIERMEAAGLVTAPRSTGAREVNMDAAKAVLARHDREGNAVTAEFVGEES